ncbi:hypothetical protein BDV10DRAFT_152587 [Aspergillus recurvatus]
MNSILTPILIKVPSPPTLLIFPFLFRYPRRTDNRRYGTERYIHRHRRQLFIIGSRSDTLLLFYLLLALLPSLFVVSLLYITLSIP